MESYLDLSDIQQARTLELQQALTNYNLQVYSHVFKNIRPDIIHRSGQFSWRGWNYQLFDFC